MIKTVHVTNAYHPSSGGIRTFYRALVDEANRCGRPLRLIVPAARHGVEDVGEHARIHYVRAPRSPWIDSRYRVLLPSQFLLPGRRLARILREEQPDLVEVCDKYSVCHLAGVIRRGWVSGLRRPVLVGLTCERMDDNVEQHLGLGPAARRWAARYMRRVYVPQFDAHIAISPYTAGELRPPPRHPRRVDVLPLGVDADRFRPSRRAAAVRRALLARVSGGARTRLLLYAGRLSREKNVGLLASTLARLAAADPGRDHRLLVAGDGPLRDAFFAEAERRAPGRAHPLGHLGPDELADVVANVDVFVHPNPREPFGIGPLEAMASGVALVAPEAGGLLSYACRETAWLAEPAPEAFARAVLDAGADSPRKRATVSRAVARAREYAWPRSAARFFALYDELVRTVRRHDPALHPAQALRRRQPAATPAGAVAVRAAGTGPVEGLG